MGLKNKEIKNKEAVNEATPESTQTIEDILKSCRIKAGIETKDVASTLKVKEKDIIDIENGEIYTKKPEIYIHGLIKTYGALLKIDPKLIKERSRPLSINSYKFDKYKLISSNKNEKLLPKNSYLCYAILIIFLFYSLSFCVFNPKDKVTTGAIIRQLEQ